MQVGVHLRGSAQLVLGNRRLRRMGGRRCRASGPRARTGKLPCASGKQTPTALLYNPLLDRELARARGQYDEGDRIRSFLARHGVTIDDQWRRWRARDGRGRRRPSAEDRTRAAEDWHEPLPRAEQDAVSAAAAGASSARVHERIFWNKLLDREAARCRGNYAKG